MMSHSPCHDIRIRMVPKYKDLCKDSASMHNTCGDEELNDGDGVITMSKLYTENSRIPVDMTDARHYGESSFDFGPHHSQAVQEI